MNNLAAMPLVLITYDGGDSKFILLIEKVMSEKFKMDKSLYSIENAPCINRKVFATHICINKDQEVKINYRNDKIMEQMLGVYWK
jgi:hypothetical protein